MKSIYGFDERLSSEPFRLTDFLKPDEEQELKQKTLWSEGTYNQDYSA